MKVTSSRRRLIVVVLLLLAVAGAVLRAATPVGSLLHDIGTLLLVMWVPAVGNILGYLMRRRAERRAAAAAPPAPWGPFRAHLRATLRGLDASAAPAAGEREGLLVVGSQGFTARLREADGGEGEVEIEFRVPQAALPNCPAHTAFQWVQAGVVRARGTVLPAAAPAPAP
jgi:hypothetical protein